MTTVISPKTAKAPEFRAKALRSLDRLPPLSPAVGRLLSKLAFRNPNFAELAQLVERDALLCAHILRTVNSAGFARASTITSVKQAIAMLGINSVRRIAVGFTVGNLFSRIKTAKTWSRIRFNLHCGATALLTDAIAGELDVENKDAAFVAGMMHDLGRLLISVGLPTEYDIITELMAVSGRPLVNCERETIGVDHAELSSLALAKWSLPEFICKSVRYHHVPDDAQAPWLAMVINRAEAFVNHLGISVDAPIDWGATGPPPEPPSLDIPGCEYDQAAVLKRFETEWKDLAEFFN